MGFKNRIIVRHIRGETFELEVERDADCLGLKLMIFEACGLPLERQRLVFAGKEMKDRDNLAILGVEMGSTVFLVEIPQEGVAPLPVPMAAPRPVEVNSQREGYPAPIAVRQPEQIPVLPMAIAVLPPVAAVRVVGVGGYQPLDADMADIPNAERILRLNKLVRRYCFVFCILNCLFAVIGGFNPGCLLSAFLFGMGLYATRRVYSCALWGPIMHAIVVFMFCVAAGVGFMFYHFVVVGIVLVCVGMVHLPIALSIAKLYVLINALTMNQRDALKARVDAQHKCCFNQWW